ncbi:MAG: hypothetical protein FWG54_01455 [Bacteroidetes bacterium]|nr:hypothetical protein [Bacteroidota bacterium]
MPFINAIKEFHSVSIVGMAKNTGKTTCLNYAVRRLREEGCTIALTSIGVDGEERDVLYDTPKPRIMLHEGVVFVTSERDFEQREFPAERLSVSQRSTPLGRLITARAKGSGKVVLSGPSDSAWLREVIRAMPPYGVELTLVDGALSRMSLASPAVTDAMILSTGAACCAQLPELIRRTQFRCTLINLPCVSSYLYDLLSPFDSGIWLLSEGQDKIEKVADTVFTLGVDEKRVISRHSSIYVAGAVTDGFLKMLEGVRLIVSDFSKLFFSALTYNRFVRKGGCIEVLQKPRLLAVCTNPVSPEGAHIDPLRLKERMEEALHVPVYDIMMIENK